MHELRSHPAVLFVLLFLAALACRAIVRAADLRVRPSIGRGLVLVASLGMTLAYAALVIWYLREPAFFDHAEPTIPAVAAVFAAGKPLYPALDAPERYAHVYGPTLFLAQAAALAFLGSSIVVWKIVGVLAILIGLVGSYAVFRRRADVHGALAGTAMCCVVFAAFDNASYWTRPDPLLVLCVVAGLLAAHARNRTASAIGLGLVTGVAVNLKVTGPVYLLPVFAIALAEHGTRTVVTAALMAVPVAAAPFLLPNVSPAHYWDYLQLSARNGLVPAKIRQNAEWAAWLAVPVAAVVADAWKAVQVRKGATAHLLALAASMAIVAVAASKPGGGPYHLLPFVPVLMYAFLWVAPPPFLTGAKPSLCAAFAASALFLALSDQAVIVRTVPGRALEDTIAALGRFADQHPGRRIAVGYAGTSYLSHARPAIVLRTRDYLLDAPAVQEHRLSGLPVPESTIRAIDGCRVELWLIPQGAEAFAVPSAYTPEGPAEVFSEEFRRAFLARHERIGEAGGFDVWECRRAGTSQLPTSNSQPPSSQAPSSQPPSFRSRSDLIQFGGWQLEVGRCSQGPTPNRHAPNRQASGAAATCFSLEVGSWRLGVGQALSDLLRKQAR